MSTKQVKLSTICDIYDGTHQTPKYVDSGVRFLSVENINDIAGSNKFISEEDYNRDFKVHPERNDILMTRIGDIGTPAIVNDNSAYAYYVSLALLKCKQDRVHPQWLKQAITTNEFQHQLWLKTLHVAFPKKINKGEIGECLISLPSLEEQKHTAKVLDIVDEVISEREEEVKDLEKQKKGLMQKIFSGQLRFTDSNNNPYPDWEESTIGNLFSIKAGGDIDSQKCSKKKTDTYKYPVYANALSKNGLYGYTDEYKVSGDTITVTGRGDVGHATPRHEQYYPIVRLLVLTPKYSANVDFFASLINSTKIFIEFTGVPQLTSPQLAKVKVKYPCLEEQQKIANLLSKLDELIEEKQALLSDWQSFKKGLLQQMFV